MTDTIQNFKNEVVALKEEAIKEAYEYFREEIHPFERDEKGLVIAHNNDVDAFRHVYVSGVMTQKYGDFRANLLGQLKELEGDIFRNQPEEEKNMDLWNNAVGRKYGEQTKFQKKLAELLKEALSKGELIIDPHDEREYKGLRHFDYDPEKPVKVIQESESGRNQYFLDFSTGDILDRETFVTAIESGNYPGYTISTINSIKTPMSKQDKVTSNNLG